MKWNLRLGQARAGDLILLIPPTVVVAAFVALQADHTLHSHHRLVLFEHARISPHSRGTVERSGQPIGQGAGIPLSRCQGCMVSD